MIVFALVMYAIDRVAKLDRELDALTWADAIVIGLAQALALLPRCVTLGHHHGDRPGHARSTASRRPVLLSAERPGVGGAAAVKALEVARNGLPAGTATPFAVGIAAAAISGLLAVWFVIAYLKRHNFNLFVIYRIIAGVAVLILIVAGVRSGMGI